VQLPIFLAAECHLPDSAPELSFHILVSVIHAAEPTTLKIEVGAVWPEHRADSGEDLQVLPKGLWQ
jgi:hypothetical protein